MIRSTSVSNSLNVSSLKQLKRLNLICNPNLREVEGLDSKVKGRKFSFFAELRRQQFYMLYHKN